MLNLIAQGPWMPEQVVVTSRPSTRPVIAEVEEVIARTWDENQKRLGDALFDGPMSRLESFAVRDGKLHLNLSTTSYRVFLGTNLCHAELADRFGREVLANAIGMSVALVTTDNKLVMGRRNDRVAYYPNRVHPFAGALEPRDVPGIFEGMRRELEEELNLPADQVNELRMLAVIEDQRLRQPEFIFSARTSRSEAELIRLLDNAEHQDLWSCEASVRVIDQVLNKINSEGRLENDYFTPVGVGTLLMFCRHVLGSSSAQLHKRFIGKEKD